MKRTILAGVSSAAIAVAVSGTGCQNTGIGDPCTPEAEYSTSFAGFSFKEVSTESADYQCFSRLCLVNHFQGRVSCPYGQDANRNNGFPASATATAPKGCLTPFINQPVDVKVNGNFVDQTLKSTVNPQCQDRRADQTVYCSCRCANLNGKTDDGAVYCACPDGYSCTQLYSSIGGARDSNLTGAYCIKSGSDFDPNAVCAATCTVDHNSGSGNCGSAQGAQGG
jgi:hypothetical protein